MRLAGPPLVFMAVLLVAAGSALADDFVIVDGMKIPAFPNNIVVFPERDFISVEGYENYAGENALTTVTRGGEIVGSAIANIASGGVAYEINHPGGVCWGADTDINVTPDLQHGDLVRVSVNGLVVGETRIQKAFVDSTQLSGSTYTVLGTFGDAPALANKEWTEQRIIQPDWKDTAIGRRDARSLPGPPVLEEDTAAYTSGMDINSPAGGFTSTFVFADAELAAPAASGTTRIMAWQHQDADGNRQGLTISEYRELGGPGMGGCPAGPGDIGSPVGDFSAVLSEDKTSYNVSWTAVKPVSGDAPQLKGFLVDAINNVAADGQNQVKGIRVMSGSATKGQITGLDPIATYTVEVRSLAALDATTANPSPPMKASDPFKALRAGRDPEDPDKTPPNVTAEDPVNNKVAIVSDRPDTDIYYTITNSSDSVNAHQGGGNLNPAADTYESPIDISGSAVSTICWIGYDADDYYDFDCRTFNSSGPSEILVAPEVDPLGTSAGQLRVTLRVKPAPPGSDITDFLFQLYDNTTNALVGNKTATAAERTVVYEGLTAGRGYVWRAAGTGAGNPPKQGPWMNMTTTALVPGEPTDIITFATGRFRASKDMRVQGSGSVVGATITLHRANAGNTGPGEVFRSGNAATGLPVTTTVTAVAGVAGGEWQVRLVNGAVPATNPGNLWAVSSGKGVARIGTLGARRRRMLQ